MALTQEPFELVDTVLLYYVCDFIYTCVLSLVLLPVLSGMSLTVLSVHIHLLLPFFLPCSM